MCHFESIKPIGLDELCNEVENTCVIAKLLNKCGLRPKHLLISIDPGSGRTTFIKYMNNMYKTNGVLPYDSGLDDYIEGVFDGDIQQERKVFDTINSAAIYKNHYSEIVALDISEIAYHEGEQVYFEFLDKIKRVCDSACLVFFTSSCPGRDESNLIRVLCEEIDNIKYFSVPPYSKEDLCKMVIQDFHNHNVEVRNTNEFKMVISKLVDYLKTDNAKKIVKAAGELITLADINTANVVVDGKEILMKLSVPKDDKTR